MFKCSIPVTSAGENVVNLADSPLKAAVDVAYLFAGIFKSKFRS